MRIWLERRTVCRAGHRQQTTLSSVGVRLHEVASEGVAGDVVRKGIAGLATTVLMPLRRNENRCAAPRTRR